MRPLRTQGLHVLSDSITHTYTQAYNKVAISATKGSLRQKVSVKPVSVNSSVCLKELLRIKLMIL